MWTCSDSVKLEPVEYELGCAKGQFFGFELLSKPFSFFCAEFRIVPVAFFPRGSGFAFQVRAARQLIEGEPRYLSVVPDAQDKAVGLVLRDKRFSCLMGLFFSFENFGDERVGFGAFSNVEMLFHDMLLKDGYGRTILTTSAVTCFSPALAARFRAAMVMLAIMRG